METTRTVSAIDVARERVRFDMDLIDVIEEEATTFSGPIDDFNPFSIGLWTYYEPTGIQRLSDGVRRTKALIWLRRHTILIQHVARRMGCIDLVEKFANESHFGTRVILQPSDYVQRNLTAQVSSALTCEMVPTGEVRHIPARDVPVMERRCPESIFAGIEQEVAV